MKRDHGLSETVSVILIMVMVLILAIVIAAFVLGVNIIPQNPAYIAVDIQKIPVSGTEAISIFHRAGDTASLKNITDQQQYVVSFYADTTSGSYRLQPPSGVDTFSPGATLFVYNTSTGIYKITNNRADLVSASPPVSLTSVRLVDEKSHQLVAQWKNSTGSSSGGTSVLLPTVTGISPAIGPVGGGTSVIVTGTNLTVANNVKFGGQANTTGGMTVTSATSITVTSPSGSAGTVDITVTTPGGTSAISPADQFTYAGVPTVTGIAPPTGPTTGVTGVTITGTNLIGATAVTFGGTGQPTFTVGGGGTTITLNTLAHTAGLVNVIVTTPNGTATGTGAYTFIDPPTFGSIAPQTGPTTGGTGVTITGTNLIGATAVTFDSASATILTNTATQITATTPGHAATGPVNVLVITPNGTATGTVVYTYAGIPTVSGIIPASGPIAGGTFVTITGTDLIGATSVTFGGTGQPTFTVGGSGTTITLNTPAHAAGAVNVMVTTPNGTVTGAGAYTYNIPLTAIGAITGTPQVGSILTAGALTPSGATASYQWQRSATSGGTYTAISGATSATYTPVVGDVSYYIEVVATGTGSYSGTVTSVYVGPVTGTPITAIGATTGTPQVGSILTAGTLTPSGATASYQWQRSSTSGGTYIAISGATSATYTPVVGDVSYYIEVVATGMGSYSGTVTSVYVGPVTGTPITAIGAITGTPLVGSILTAGALTPSGATASYQWSRSTTSGGTYTAISGATTNTYTPVVGDLTYYLKVTATGTGSYTGTVTSAYVGPVTATSITAIGAITGTPQVGSLLTAGTLTPSGATASYQWSRSTTSGGTYTAISGATTNTYTPVVGDLTYYLKVTATGTGSYTGTVTSAYVGPVTRIPLTAIGAITGTPQTGSVLTAGALTPSGATASYQWSRSTTAGGTYTSISGATSATYTPVTGDRSYYIRVTATGTGSYTGTVISAAVGPVKTPITAIAAFTGTLQSGNQQTAGGLTPSGATASYQWSRSTTSGGTYTDISGATSNRYRLVSGDFGYYIRVTATGTGSYTGTVTSAARGPVAA